MVTNPDVLVRDECFRPNCPTCYPADNAYVEWEEPVPEPIEPAAPSTKTEQIKAAIYAATGLHVDVPERKQDDPA